ncbi:MAG: indole-3-glycerol phosphate synthase TrpC [Acidobacteriota bacterium]
MTDVLARIVADKRTRLDRGEYAASARDAAIPPPDGARFVASLREPGVRIIAEIKHRSPSAGEILPGAAGKVETMALAYRRGHAAALSVVVEEDHFGGRPEWLPRARRIAGLPALWKDFVVSARQVELAGSLGADAILLIARILTDAELAALSGAARELGMAVVVEAHDAAEIARAAAAGPDVLGVNARDLSSFATRLETLEALAPGLPKGPVRLAESGIHGPADIARLRQAGYEAFLVGEALLRSEDPEGALRELRA